MFAQESEALLNKKKRKNRFSRKENQASSEATDEVPVVENTHENNKKENDSSFVKTSSKEETVAEKIRKRKKEKKEKKKLDLFPYVTTAIIALILWVIFKHDIVALITNTDQTKIVSAEKNKTEKVELTAEQIEAEKLKTMENNATMMNDYIIKRKKNLLSYFVNTDLAMDILSDAPLLSIKGSYYKSGEDIGQGFALGKISFVSSEAKNSDFEDIKMTVQIKDKKTKKIIRDVSLRIGDYYSFIFYDGGIEMTSNETDETTGVVLEGERLTSAFTVINIEKSGTYFKYDVHLLGGENFTKMISEDKIN